MKVPECYIVVYRCVGELYFEIANNANAVSDTASRYLDFSLSPTGLTNGGR